MPHCGKTVPGRKARDNRREEVMNTISFPRRIFSPLTLFFLKVSWTIQKVNEESQKPLLQYQPYTLEEEDSLQMSLFLLQFLTLSQSQQFVFIHIFIGCLCFVLHLALFPPPIYFT